MASGRGGTGMSPQRWREWAQVDARGASRPGYLDRALVEEWHGTSETMRQPALDHHMIVLHRGGPKRVHRASGRVVRTYEVPLNGWTTVESGSAYRWRTEGPIAFAHVYVHPSRFAETVGQAFGREPGCAGLAEAVGQDDPHVARLIELLIEGRGGPDWATAAEYYLDALLVRIAASAAATGEFRAAERLMLAPATVRRVQDYVRANIAAKLSLADMASVAGYSRYHFVRAFRRSTGLPPYAWLLMERVRAAQAALRESERPLEQVARAAGFGTHRHFSTRFRDVVGVSPAEYRRSARGSAQDGSDPRSLRR